ncbi:MAG TPA: peptidoglycan -binding protein [Alphaproteobacteria bacterium]|nr:peptidoglycan -binding protein [Alphaproteobacteria bacterium]
MPAGRRTARTVDIWPGFVDALATLILVIVFVLMVFTLFQFYLKDVISGRDQALARLSSQLGDLADQLALEKKANADLNTRIGSLNDELQASLTTRERLQQEADEAKGRADKVSADLEDANKVIQADKEKIDAQLGQLDALRKNIETLTALRDELQKKVDVAGSDLTAQKDLTKDAQARADLLTRQIAALQQQLATLNAALGISEDKAKADQVQIADLGKRLNAALAGRVEELTKFRSEFFGRLRQVLGDRPDVRVVGDRFVFQSEVLFPSGSAELQPDGKQQLDGVADALATIAKEMPQDLPWILQVDGHTDNRPISTPQFPSNWELSAARAISVVKYLTSRGIPADRLAAAGFGEFEPIDPRNDEVGWRRNRRIEIKVTSR